MRVAYFAAGPASMASSRLRVWKISEFLQGLGHDVVIYYDMASLPPTIREDLKKYDAIVVQKRFDITPLMQYCREELRVRVIWDCDDYIPNGPVDCADVVTVDTLGKLPLYPGALVIPDCLDLAVGTPVKQFHRELLKKIVWFGNAANLFHVANAYKACVTMGLELVCITDLFSPDFIKQYDEATYVQWDDVTVDEGIRECDLAICPLVFSNALWSRDWVESKSANRVLKAWGLGMPVAGTSIPEYTRVGLVIKAETVREWEVALELAKNPKIRQSDALYGLNISYNYQISQIGPLWLKVLTGEV